jgi:uncharacterized protein (DUF2147 family)
MRRWIPAGLVLGATLAAATASAAGPVERVWLTQAKDARVRIAPCAPAGDRLCGTIISLQTPLDEDGRPKLDEHNPDAAQRNRPVLGLTVIRDFRPAGPGRWDHGKIYDPKTGRTYASKMRLDADGTLKVDGCVAMFCQTQTWRRAD